MTAGAETGTLSADAVERILAFDATSRYELSLYVIGTTSRSARAIVNIRQICETYLQGRYELTVIDVAQQPQEAKRAQIVATPTLIKHLPLPARRFVGDMSQTERLIVGLDLAGAN